VSVVYSPSGTTVMTVGDDGRVIVWDPRSGRRVVALPGPAGHIQDAQVSPDGATFYTAGTGGVMLAGPDRRARLWPQRATQRESAVLRLGDS
jgi:WD40 repeat protein